MTPGGRTARNIAFIAAGEAAARLAQFVTVALLGRALGPEGFGVVSIAWTLSQIFLPLAVEGPDVAGVRRFARHPAQRLFHEIAAAKIIFAFCGALAVGLTGAALFRTDPVLIRQAAAQATVILPFGLMTVWLLRAQEQFAYAAFLRGFQAILFLAIIALVLDQGGTVWSVPLAEAAAGLATALIAVFLTARQGWAWPGLRGLAAAMWPGTIAISREALSIGLAGAAAAVTWIAVVPLSAFFLDESQVGLIGAALRLVLVLNSVAPLVLQVFFPRLARQGAESASGTDGRRPGHLLRPLLLGAAAGAGLAALLANACAHALINITFGAAYAGAVLPFEILVATLLPQALSVVLGQGLLATGAAGAYLAVMICGSLLCLAGLALVLAISPSVYAVTVPVAVICLQCLALFALAWRRGLLGPGR